MFVLERKMKPWGVGPAGKPKSQAWNKAFKFRTSLRLKDADVMFTFDQLPYMTTISRQLALLYQPFEYIHSSINQDVETIKTAPGHAGTKLG